MERTEMVGYAIDPPGTLWQLRRWGTDLGKDAD
jgi:hypothetical protein